MVSWLLLGLFFTTFFSILLSLFTGWILIISMIIVLVSSVIMIYYLDRVTLSFLSARPTTLQENEKVFRAANLQAYKLETISPEIYYYHGTIKRAFVLQHGKRISLLLHEDLISDSSDEELGALFFSLLVQVKKGFAKKRTRIMFLIGLIAWGGTETANILGTLLPGKNSRKNCYLAFMYLFSPISSVLFKVGLGRSFFDQMILSLSSYSQESEEFQRYLKKIKTIFLQPSFTTKSLQLYLATQKSTNLQIQVILENLPHEWERV